MLLLKGNDCTEAGRWRLRRLARPPSWIQTYLATVRVGLATRWVTRPVSVRLAYHQAAPCRTENRVLTRSISCNDKNTMLLQVCLWILNHFGNPTDFSEGGWVWNTWLTLITLFRNSRPFLFRGDSTVPGTWRVFHKSLLERWSDSCYSENPECDASSFCHCSWD